MEDTTSASIDRLPPEILLVIFKYLNGEDLDACFNVSQSWRSYLNINAVWRRCCIYPEKYFLNDPLQSDGENAESCKWRQIYERQQTVWNNWSKGKFVKEKTNFCASEIVNTDLFSDSHGHHWLFKSNEPGITVKKLTRTSISDHCKINRVEHISILPITDKILSTISNYIKVFQFKYPEYDINLEYQFKFDMDNVLPVNEVVPDNYYMSCVRYILLLDRFLVGYKQNLVDLQTSFFHIWDLSLAKKIAVHSAFQQSFVDFVRNKTGSDITQTFEGGLILFADGDSTRFLVNVIADRFSLCQVSLFSLDEMRFMNVVAQIESRTAWCFMHGDVVAIYHLHKEEDTSQISVYNVNGQFLAKLDFPARHNPAFTDEFWFSKASIILKVESEIHILKFIDSKNVYSTNFKTNIGKYILGYFDPRFLVMFDKHIRRVEYHSNENFSFVPVSIWDTETGLELWTLKDMISIDIFSVFKGYKYPGKLFVHFQGDQELSVLNFECSTNEHNED